MRAPIAERHSARGWTPFSAGVFAIVALLLGSNLPNPLFPLYAKTFGLSPLDITLVFATYTLLVIPALILLAPPSDARGRRPARQRVDRRRRRHGRSVRGGYGCRLAVRRAGRAGVRARRAARDGGAGARRGDPSENVRRSAAIASAATLAGAALGPLLAGFLGQYGPLSPRLPYLVEIALLVCALGAARLLPEAREPHRYRPRRPEIPREIRRRFGLASVSAFVGWPSPASTWRSSRRSSLRCSATTSRRRVRC